jgi:hypothetical protein
MSRSVIVENNDNYATSTKQDTANTSLSSIETKLDELNDGNNTIETVSLTASTMTNTVSHNTNNYSHYEVIVNSTGGSTQALVQWSQDNVNWYHVDFYSTVFATSDVDGTSNSQNNVNFTGDVKAKYMRVRLYDTSAVTCKVLINLIH